jgi:sulfinoalanine decarboxylase
MLLKSRGTLGVEKMIDNAFTSADYFRDKISNMEGFRLVIPKFQYTNVCFWYIPKELRGLEETEEWWMKIYKITKRVKEAMQMSGRVILSCNSLPQRKIGFFFRLPIKCCPPVTESTLDHIIEQVKWFGENIK